MTDDDYSTNNTPLSTALATCGVPLTYVDVVYSEAYLRENGFANCAQAEFAGAPGNRVYHFQKTGELQPLLDAWQAQQDLIRKLKQGGVDTASELKFDPRTAMRVMCQFASNRVVLINLRGKNWFQAQIGNESYAMVTTNASRALRREVGL